MTIPDAPGMRPVRGRHGIVRWVGQRPSDDNRGPEVQPCGTEAAYRRHMRAEETCEQCGAGKRGRPPAPECGTDSGYYRHKRKLKEAACEACIVAHRVAQRTRKGQRAREDIPLKPCGTRAAYDRHKHAGEEPCEPCKQAFNEYHRAKRERAKQRAEQRDNRQMERVA